MALIHLTHFDIFNQLFLPNLATFSHQGLATLEEVRHIEVKSAALSFRRYTYSTTELASIYYNFLCCPLVLSTRTLKISQYVNWPDSCVCFSWWGGGWGGGGVPPPPLFIQVFAPPPHAARCIFYTE